MAEKPKEGSRKRTVFDLFMKKGGTYDAAIKKGEELGLASGTIRSWCMTWDRGKVPASPKKTPPPRKGKGETKKTGEKTTEAPKRAVGPPPEFLPHFKHKTRGSAEDHLAAICKRGGLRASAFHILEEQGRFAVVPAHHKPPSPPPTFKVGDVVFDAYIPNGMAKVTGPGPEQTEIEYVYPRPSGLKHDCINNYYLIKLKPEEMPKEDKKTKGKKTSTKIKRVKL